MIKDENTQDGELDEKKIPNEDDQNNDESQDDSDDDKSSDQDKSDDDKSDDIDWKSKALGYKAILDRNKNKKPESKSAKSDEFDYGKMAFLTSNGIKGTKEIDFVNDEAKKSGMKLTDLLENEYFQSKLDKFRALNKTAEATIKGKDSKGIQTDSVEYWLNKPIEDVPPEMRIKVVNAKLKQNESTGVFYNSKK